MSDEETLLAAGWSESEYKKWIVPLGESRPWKRSDPDGYMSDYELCECSEFLTMDYSMDFEYLDAEGNSDCVPSLKLERLHRRKKLTKETSARIGRIVYNNRRLVYLDIDASGIDKDIALAFFQHWHGKNCHVQCLNMDGTDLGGSGFGEFIHRLLSNNSQLVELKLTNTKLTEGDARALASALLSGPSTLKHLSLMNNSIEHEGLKAISEAVRAMPNVETIDLMGNKVTKLFESISQMIHHPAPPKLRKINLRFCGLTDEFATSLKNETNLWKMSGFYKDFLTKQKADDADAKTGKRKR
mmetsp:Transcript_20614/g.37249  ORF Transcript_20614/g.37249 Transcript_20614/m.37249 type:complete len:300 (+) Transcript_20614:90-989(+)